MLFSWLKKRRRQRLLLEPFPETWCRYLRDNVPFSSRLPTEVQSRLLNLVQIFVAEKRWIGCDGLEVDDEMKVTIAAQACLLLLGLAPEDDFCYDQLASILIYPGAFAIDEPADDSDAWLGEAWFRGPIILSWEHSQSGGRELHDGRNLVLHEFAHQIDGLDGQMGGSPPLRTPRLREQWEPVVHSEFTRLESDTQSGRETFFDPYGATNRSEFFAVATEHFFEQPGQFLRFAPELYHLFEEFYALDPVTWFGEEIRDPESIEPFDQDIPERETWEEDIEESVLVAAQLTPGSVDALFTLGVLCLSQDKYEKAIEHLSRAIRLDSEDSEIYQHRGEAFLRLGQNDDAIADCNRALELNPDDIDAYRTRGKTYLATGQYERAIDDLSQAIDDKQKDPESYYRRGLAWMGLGQFHLAVRDFNRAIHLSPQRSAFYLARSKAYQALGHDARADADHNEAMRRDSNIDPKRSRGGNL